MTDEANLAGTESVSARPGLRLGRKYGQVDTADRKIARANRDKIAIQRRAILL